MKKIFSFGKIDFNNTGEKINLVTIEVELKERNGNPVFTASGNIWNSRKSDIIMGGQCIDSIYTEFKNQISDKQRFEKIMNLWQRNHLNDLNAGTPEQSAIIENAEKQGWKYDYSQACELLKKAGKYEVIHNGKLYKYGTAWIYRAIAPEDLKEIKSLFD